jgi:DNA (cytosine-5)-methyltransferase 1
MKEIRAIDLCCGAGGWACAARGLPIRITHAFDCWAEAAKTYEINHPLTEVVCGDLTAPVLRDRVKGHKGEVDLVVGGIPCEWLSVYRNGWNPRTVPTDQELKHQRLLLDTVLVLVDHLRPRWWCLEDVVGIVRELPPLLPWIELNASAWSPQARRRVFLGEFPAPLPPEPPNGQVLQDCLRLGPYRVGGQLWGRQPVTSNAFRANRCNSWNPAAKSKTVAQFLNSRRDGEVGVLDDRLPGGKRQLEWQEGARLQGFPEDYLFYGSPTAVVKMIAQAIQIDLGRAILSAIVNECTKGQTP